MSNSSNISLPRQKCMKCQEKDDIILSSCTYTGYIGRFCDHTFCQSCFRKENIASTLSYQFTCPFCHFLFYGDMQSFDEAILIGEAATLRNHIYHQLVIPRDVAIEAEDIIRIDKINKMIIEKLELALLLNSANFYTLYLLFSTCHDGHRFLVSHKLWTNPPKFYRLKLFDFSYKLLDNPALTEGREIVRSDVFFELTRIFQLHHNYPAAYQYAKQAYEYCLRSSEHRDLSSCKTVYLVARDDFTALPLLRFSVGDEVEFLHELETGSEWKLGKVVELYYRERDFDITFNAPYRLLLLDEHEGDSPVYAWVKADLDRYVRKVGVRLIEDTRYQARLDAKVEELMQVYYSKEFMQDIYCALAQDREFVDMLQSVWQIELSELMLYHFRTLVMYRQQLIRTDSGYHLLTTEEVVAGIKAYFDPEHLSGDAAGGENSDSQELRVYVISALQGYPTGYPDTCGEKSAQGLLLRSISSYKQLLYESRSADIPPDHDIVLSVPAEVSDAISRVSIVQALKFMHKDGNCSSELKVLLDAWIWLLTCLELPNVGSACECPFVYFFVRFCLDQDLGVPKLALAVYDRMNMQLSREFIRCANPSCELNKLDQSTGQVKFKLCSRCKAVIYCSKDCQTAHYPEHKSMCREHT